MDGAHCCCSGHLPVGHYLERSQLHLCDAHNRPYVSLDWPGGTGASLFFGTGRHVRPFERSKWVGLLNIPAGIFAFVGPTLGGWFVDSLSWRYIFWCGTPLLIMQLMVLFACPDGAQTKPKVDGRGALLAAVASSTLILAFSLAGTIYPWASIQVLGLLAVSLFLGAFYKV